MRETQSSAENRRIAGVRFRTLEHLRRFWRVGIQIATRGNIRFQKYRVAPRLGTNTVRQRLLLGLHTRAALTATETGMV